MRRVVLSRIRSLILRHSRPSGHLHLGRIVRKGLLGQECGRCPNGLNVWLRKILSMARDLLWYVSGDMCG